MLDFALKSIFQGVGIAADALQRAQEHVMSKTVISQVQKSQSQADQWIGPTSYYKPHFDLQGEQEVLARMEVEVQAARLLTWKVSFLLGGWISYLEG